MITIAVEKKPGTVFFLMTAGSEFFKVFLMFLLYCRIKVISDKNVAAPLIFNVLPAGGILYGLACAYASIGETDILCQSKWLTIAIREGVENRFVPLRMQEGKQNRGPVKKIQTEAAEKYSGSQGNHAGDP